MISISSEQVHLFECEILGSETRLKKENRDIEIRVSKLAFVAWRGRGREKARRRARMLLREY